MESQAVDAGYQTWKFSAVCCVGTNKLQFSASGVYASVTGDRKSYKCCPTDRQPSWGTTRAATIFMLLGAGHGDCNIPATALAL